MIEYSVEIIKRLNEDEYDLINEKNYVLKNKNILKKYNFKIIEKNNDFILYKLIKNKREHKNYYIQHYIFIEL